MRFGTEYFFHLSQSLRRSRWLAGGVVLITYFAGGSKRCREDDLLCEYPAAYTAPVSGKYTPSKIFGILHIAARG